MTEGPFNRGLRRQRHSAARAGFASADFLHQTMVTELQARVAMVARDFGAVLDVGGPVPAVHGAVRCALAAEPSGVVADEDRLPFADASFDLVVSAGGLATVNDLPGALAQMRRVLRPDGLFVAALVGGMTLVELRSVLIAAEAALTNGAAARTAPMVEASAAAGLLQRAGFAMPVADVERVTVRYPHLLALCDDLRVMGARSVLQERQMLRRDVLADAIARFAALAGPDGKTAVTVDILYLTGWAPGPGQPQPKAPGSATTSLARALSSRV